MWGAWATSFIMTGEASGYSVYCYDPCMIIPQYARPSIVGEVLWLTPPQLTMV